MADFARLLLALDVSRGGTESFDAYAEQARAVAESVAESDPVAEAIRKQITETSWEGSAADLLERLQTPERPPRDWPPDVAGHGRSAGEDRPGVAAPGLDGGAEAPDRHRTGLDVVPPRERGAGVTSGYVIDVRNDTHPV